jgi:hypothetical protein
MAFATRDLLNFILEFLETSIQGSA